MRSRARKFTHSAFCGSTCATSFDCDDEPQLINEDTLATLNHKDIFVHLMGISEPPWSKLQKTMKINSAGIV